MALFPLLIAHALAASPAVDSVPGEFATIQQAIDQGTSPIIEVGPGRWAGARVTRPVILRGAPGAKITMGANPRTVNSPLGIGFALDERASGSEIEGFTFACSASKSLDVGVYSSASRYGSAADDVRVANNTFVGCFQGVTNAGRSTTSCRPKAVSGGEYWLVEGNTFDGIRSTAHTGLTGGGIGVFLYNAENVDVLDNDFVGAIQDRRDFTTGGVVVAGCRDCAIVGNDFAVTGATGWWASISNMGYYQQGAAATERLYVADNDASNDYAPDLDVNFRSLDSYDVDFVDNQGVTFIDHSWCGDKRVETFDSFAGGSPSSARR